MSLAKPPYRADLVGSFLRPDSVKAVRKARAQKSGMGADELRAIEDEAIRDVIRM